MTYLVSPISPEGRCVCGARGHRKPTTALACMARDKRKREREGRVMKDLPPKLWHVESGMKVLVVWTGRTYRAA